MPSLRDQSSKQNLRKSAGPNDQGDAHFVVLNGTRALMSHSVNALEAQQSFYT